MNMTDRQNRIERRVSALFSAFLQECEIILGTSELAMLSSNHALPMMYVEKNMNLKWNYHLIGINALHNWEGDIAKQRYTERRFLDFVYKTQKMLRWNMEMVCDVNKQHGHVDDIKLRQEIPKQIVLDAINLHNLDVSSTNWNKLSADPRITWEDVLQYPNYPWDYKTMTPNVNVGIVRANPDLDWDFNEMSKAKWFCFGLMIMFIGKPLNYSEIFGREDIIRMMIKHKKTVRECISAHDFRKMNLKTEKLVEKEYKGRMTFRGENVLPFVSLSQNPAITVQFIEDNNIRWYHSLMAGNTNIPLELLIKHCSIRDMDVRSLSTRADLSLDIIKKYNDISWDWRSIAKNNQICLDIFISGIMGNLGIERYHVDQIENAVHLVEIPSPVL